MNRLIVNNIAIPAEIAISEEEQIRGLQFRKSLSNAMAFVYPVSQVNAFWMQDTYIPLDIIFCNKGVVKEICEGVPHNLTPVGNVLSNLVVEMPRGSADKLGIKTGTEIELKLDVLTAAKSIKFKYFTH